MKKFLFFICLIVFSAQTFAQQEITWYEPAFVEGVCVTDTSNIFHRLPSAMKDKVRQPVWDLSENTAGEFIHFKTTAHEITVHYIVKNKNFSMPHMPATGESGLDLFAMDINGNWNWAAPEYHFGDTCKYVFNNLYLARNATSVADFYLYLPLYNSVTWLSIGVNENEKFSFAGKRQENPIVAYGTSILQGGVTSRAGLAWTNILERNLDRTIINLGFSGNGKFEAPLFDLMATVDAKMYILDCMPNLTRGISAKEISDRVVYGVNKLREQNKSVPILFAEHAVGYAPFYMDTASLNGYHRSSLVIKNIFNALKASGVGNLYLLTDKEINFDINSTTEGLHPNDIGMMKYAVAYEKKIREILNEPVGEIPTEVPVEQYRDGYDWLQRHREVRENIEKTHPKVLLIGNSIINFWGGMPEGMVTNGGNTWEKYMAPLQVQNAGYGWDRIENVLWRVYHGELDHFDGSTIVMMIGTNNLQINPDEEIVAGLQFLLNAIKTRKPSANIIMAGILPRVRLEDKVRGINQKIKAMCVQNQVSFVDPGKDLLNGNSVDLTLFLKDGLHPNAKGYEVLGKSLTTILSNSGK